MAMVCQQYPALGAIAASIAIVVALNGVFKFIKSRKSTSSADDPQKLLNDVERTIQNKDGLDEHHVTQLTALQQQLKKAAIASLQQRAKKLGIELAPEVEEKREEAVEDMLEEGEEGDQQALQLIAAGYINEALDQLSKKAEAATIDVADQWRTIAELANGVDTTRAISAYEKLITLTTKPNTWDYIHLARLYITNGQRAKTDDLVQTSLAQTQEGTREYFILLDEKAKALILTGHSKEAEAILNVIHDGMEERLLTDPDNTEWQRDLMISHTKLAFIPDSGISWQRVVDLLEEMQHRGILAPVDIPLIEDTQSRLEEELNGAG